ncbi:MAG: DNA/RNA non-specific endonuclease [Lachnospiraceae bacterium]|nr:DNA/RNA non-specific endonuclease [Lachnospiraceae bacterium]
MAVIVCAAAVFAAWYFHNKNQNEAQPVPETPASSSIVDSDPGSIPEYSGEDVIELAGGVPGFNEYDIENISGEIYSELDELGRCGTAVALLDRSMMPTGGRESMEEIHPSGWVQAKYPGIVDADPPYLYNRSHLIAYAMTGQNANPLNLITGTRYMNAVTMLEYEEIVLQYLDDTDCHVLYRVSPYFKDYELVARGVEIEAYSVEDKGWGVSFHVFIYNVQPGIEIDYQTGSSSAAPED